MPDLKKKFDAAAASVLKAKKDPGNDMKLRLYAHYKQATEGDVAGEKPGFTDFVNRAKYEAWAKLKGTPADKAMEAYIKLAAPFFAAPFAWRAVEAIILRTVSLSSLTWRERSSTSRAVSTPSRPRDFDTRSSKTCSSLSQRPPE